jgi:hypothetical protein
MSVRSNWARFRDDQVGLALVNQLARAMGGHVDVVNCEPGAEFRVTIAVCRGLHEHIQR